METMKLIMNTPPRDLATRSDEEIEQFFAEAGLEVEVVAHCVDLTCPTCFAPIPARAA